MVPVHMELRKFFLKEMNERTNISTQIVKTEEASGRGQKMNFGIRKIWILALSLGWYLVLFTKYFWIWSFQALGSSISNCSVFLSSQELSVFGIWEYPGILQS